MKSKSLIVFIAVLFLFIVSLALRCYKTNSDCKSHNELLSRKYSVVKDIVSQKIITSNTSIGYIFDENLLVEDESCEKIEFPRIISSRRILVCRVSDTHCKSCDIESLKSLLNAKVKISSDKIIILGSFNNTLLLKEFLSANEINYRAYNIKGRLDIDADRFHFPYFLVLNNELEVISCFFPEKAMPELTNDYLKGIKHFFN